MFSEKPSSVEIMDKAKELQKDKLTMVRVTPKAYTPGFIVQGMCAMYFSLKAPPEVTQISHMFMPG